MTFLKILKKFGFTNRSGVSKILILLSVSVLIAIVFAYTFYSHHFVDMMEDYRKVETGNGEYKLFEKETGRIFTKENNSHLFKIIKNNEKILGIFLIIAILSTCTLILGLALKLPKIVNTQKRGIVSMF